MAQQVRKEQTTCIVTWSSHLYALRSVMSSFQGKGFVSKNKGRIVVKIKIAAFFKLLSAAGNIVMIFKFGY